jgi:hypothetical protein
MSKVKEHPFKKYSDWDFERWKKEIKKAKADLQSSNDGYLSHQEDLDRTKRQEMAAWRYSELVQGLRYMIGEREDLPRKRDPRDYLKEYYRHIN